MNRNSSVSGSKKFSEAFSSSSKKLNSGRFTSEEMESVDRKKYPIRSEDYELFEEIGQGVSASVYRALCIPLNEVVAIKILDFERNNSDLSNISRETQTMILVDHPNVVRAHCSFANDQNLWVVMPFMAGGSCLHILKAAYPDGFEEVVIATILREVLKGLDYLHHHGHIHRDVKAGNILIDVRGAVKLGDFGVSACLFDSGDRQRSRNTFVGTPCWMAPEVMEQLHGYDFKADIWSFGITALELAHGHAPFSKYPPMKVLLMTLQNAPPSLDYERDRKFSKSFKQMIAMCLVKDPFKRPSAHKLLKHSFFKQARSNDYISRTLLEGLPSLGDRLRALKIKEADMLAQKKMPYGKKEELSQSEYKRGISSWNFNIEDMKAQASLIQDVDETIPDKEQGGSSSSSVCGLDTPQKNSRCSSSVSLKDDMAEKEDEDMMLNKQASLSPGPTPNNLKENCHRTEDEFTTALSNRKLVTLQNGLLSHDNGTENGLSEKHEQVDEKRLNVTPSSSLEKGFLADFYVTTDPCLSPFKGESERHQGQIPNTGVCNGLDSILEIVPIASKLTASNSDADDKSKGPVVQQRGRFKVTSENVELEKALPTPGLHKSQSLQVIPQLLATSQSSSDATASNLSGSSLFPQLHVILQTNMVQRDNILTLMKQICIGQVSNGDLSACHTVEGEYMPTSTASMERTLLDGAHQREKDLLQEVNDLQWKLIYAQDELQKLGAKLN